MKRDTARLIPERLPVTSKPIDEVSPCLVFHIIPVFDVELRAGFPDCGEKGLETFEPLGVVMLSGNLSSVARASVEPFMEGRRAAVVVAADVSPLNEKSELTFQDVDSR